MILLIFIIISIYIYYLYKISNNNTYKIILFSIIGELLFLLWLIIVFLNSYFDLKMRIFLDILYVSINFFKLIEAYIVYKQIRKIRKN